MKPILFCIFGFILTVWGCSSSKRAVSSASPQGITGQVTEASGNRMPGKGAVPSPPKGVRSTVCVYEPTTLSQVVKQGDAPVYTAIRTKQVACVETDSLGVFTISLPRGEYSLFIRQRAGYYANLFDAGNRIAVFAVDSARLTTANLVIRTGATY